jgi:DNA-binding beta-propeller fold protein YncE
MKIVLIALFVLFYSDSAITADVLPTEVRSPLQLTWLDNKTVAVCDATFEHVYILDAASGKILHTTKLKGQPRGITAVAESGLFYVTETGAGSVAEIGSDGVVKRRFNISPRPAGLAMAIKSKRLIVSDDGFDLVAVVNISDGKILGKVAVQGHPYSVVVTPDEKMAVTVSRLPVGDARREDHAAVLTMIDLEKMEVKGVVVKLLPGTGNVTGLAVSPDGKWLYITHTLGRYTLPTTQLDHGWVNSNALTIFDLSQCKSYATLLLDSPMQGVANPWGITLSSDARTAWITLSGVHELAQLNLGVIHEWLAKLTPKDRDAVCDNLTTLSKPDRLKRIPMQGIGPRGIAVSPDNSTLAVALYFSAQVSLIDTQTSVVRTCSLGSQTEESLVRKGERIFYDGKLSHQNWLSCATCHPDTRADGFNWDLPNDGIGNPKNTKTMVWADRTPPTTWLGIRDGMPHSVKSGFKFILFREPQPGEAEAVIAYLKSLEPESSPYLVNGKLSEKAVQGEKVFKTSSCVDCHSPPLFTDMKLHDVGTGHILDRDATKFDTPALMELWRTAPYLHDGSAITVEDAVSQHQKDTLSKLSKDEIAALIEYLMSL